MTQGSATAKDGALAGLLRSARKDGDADVIDRKRDEAARARVIASAGAVSDRPITLDDGIGAGRGQDRQQPGSRPGRACV